MKKQKVPTAVIEKNLKIEIVWKKLYCFDCDVEMAPDYFGKRKQSDTTSSLHHYICPKCKKDFYTEYLYPRCVGYHQEDEGAKDV